MLSQRIVCFRNPPLHAGALLPFRFCFPYPDILFVLGYARAVLYQKFATVIVHPISERCLAVLHTVLSVIAQKIICRLFFLLFCIRAQTQQCVSLCFVEGKVEDEWASFYAWLIKFLTGYDIEEPEYKLRGNRSTSASYGFNESTASLMSSIHPSTATINGGITFNINNADGNTVGEIDQYLQELLNNRVAAYGL